MLIQFAVLLKLGHCFLSYMKNEGSDLSYMKNEGSDLS